LGTGSEEEDELLELSELSLDDSSLDSDVEVSDELLELEEDSEGTGTSRFREGELGGRPSVATLDAQLRIRLSFGGLTTRQLNLE
jgi:hypothetical protein